VYAAKGRIVLSNRRKRKRVAQPLASRLIAKFYRDPDGIEPVNEFIKGQTIAAQLALDRQIDRINSLDDAHPHLAFPHSSQIEGELRELRCHYGNRLFRILYRRSRQFVILLHAFSKYDSRVSEADQKIARDRWADFRERLDGDRRRRPGPIGKKAPPKRR
jgi:phage-related protein